EQVVAALDQALAIGLVLHAGEDLCVVAFLLFRFRVFFVLFPLSRRSHGHCGRQLAACGAARLVVLGVRRACRFLLVALSSGLCSQLLVLLVVRGIRTRYPPAIGRPLELAYAALHAGQLPRFSSTRRDDPHLRLAGAGGEERYLAAVWRPFGRRVALAAARELGRLATAVGGHQPDVGRVVVLLL